MTDDDEQKLQNEEKVLKMDLLSRRGKTGLAIKISNSPSRKPIGIPYSPAQELFNDMLRHLRTSSTSSYTSMPSPVISPITPFIHSIPTTLDESIVITDPMLFQISPNDAKISRNLSMFENNISNCSNISCDKNIGDTSNEEAKKMLVRK